MNRFLRVFLTILFTLCVCSMTGCEFLFQNPNAPNPDEEQQEDEVQAPQFEQLSTKKGVCVSRYGDGTEKSAQLLQDIGISWYYNWGAEPAADNIDAEYVPMIWGSGSVNENVLNSIREGYEAGKYKYLLTFNEPDADTPGVSSGISVENALKLWPQLEALGIPLSSPAPTYYSTGWLDEFMEGAAERGYRVDFIALHCYQQFADDNVVADLRRELIEIYEKYQLPIWITEFAAIDTWVWGGHPGNPKCTQEKALSYTKEVTDMLESLGFVERYAWFIDNTGSPNENRGKEAQYTYLYNNDDKLSETGKVYKAQQSDTPIQIAAAFGECIEGKKFSAGIYANGGTGEYTFSDLAPEGVTIWSELPKGLTLSPTGVLSGIPEEHGTFDISVAVEDSNGQMTFKYFKLFIDK